MPKGELEPRQVLPVTPYARAVLSRRGEDVPEDDDPAVPLATTLEAGGRGARAPASAECCSKWHLLLLWHEGVGRSSTARGLLWKRWFESDSAQVDLLSERCAREWFVAIDLVENVFQREVCPTLVDLLQHTQFVLG